MTMATRSQKRQMALVGFMQAGNVTVYAGSWRHPATEHGFLDQRFYQKLGWRMDGDFAVGEDFRAVQLTPPGSQCSITFGKGVTTAAPGSAQDLMLIVHDIGPARDDLISRGVEVSEIYHYESRPFHSAGTEARVPGPDPDGRSYFTWASFSDPDGNGWLLQEIKTRLPGREWT